MKSVRHGAAIVAAALPFGIVASLIARFVDASGYGLSMLPVALFFICKGFFLREGPLRSRFAGGDSE